MQRSMGTHTGNGAHALSKLAARRGQYWLAMSVLQHADVAQQAERDHAMVQATSSILVIRPTILFGCVLALRDRMHGVGGMGCARSQA